MLNHCLLYWWMKELHTGFNTVWYIWWWVTVNYISLSPYFSINFFMYCEKIIYSVYSTKIYWEFGRYRKNTMLNSISTAFVIKSELFSVSFLPLQSYLMCISAHILAEQVLFEGFWIKHASRPLCLSPTVYLALFVWQI